MLNAADNVGEKAALTKLEKFISHGVDNYDQDRNFPFKDGTSKLSPHLHFGEISPLKIWGIICDNQNYEDHIVAEITGK